MPITFAQIEPTTRCNFTCGFCAGRSMRQGDLDWEAFVAFLDAHPALRHVELQGEGEPLLHPRFFDMAAECRARGIRVGIITNGSLLSAERVELLLDAGIASVHVSVESAEPEQFEAIRGGKFAKVRDGLALLMQRRGERGLERPVVGLAVTVLRSTIGAIDGVFQLYRTLGLDGGIVAQRLQPMPIYRRTYDAAMEGELLTDDEARHFIAIRQALARHAPVPSPADFFYYALFDGFHARQDSCPWLAIGAYLGSDGQVTGCCFMKDPEHALGNPFKAAARRAALRAELDAGQVPAACDGCGTANAIAQARRA